MDRNPPFQLPSRAIPARSSSISSEKGEATRLKRIRELESERQSCNAETNRHKKRLKLTSSFDTTYWSVRRDIADSEIKATRLTKQISILSFKDNTRKFLESEDGERLLVQEKTLELDSRLYAEQAEKMSAEDDKSSLRRSFVGLFIGAETGWGIKNKRGQRDNREQSSFRAELKLKMDSENPDPDKDTLWCPVTRLYWPPDSITAGHLFPWKCGPDTMNAIFGPPNNGESELFKAENGILWSTETEKRFSSGHFVIVPDISEQAGKKEIDEWDGSYPKEYKIRVLNPTDSTMTKKILNTEQRWVDLDNLRLTFKTSFRPRARYLYFSYCEAMLRRSFAGKHLEVSRAELRKRFWGTPGRYMRAGMLLGFVEEMGHEYEHLLEGFNEEEEAVPNRTAVSAANKHIQVVLKAEAKRDDENDSDSHDDECEDDDEEVEEKDIK